MHGKDDLREWTPSLGTHGARSRFTDGLALNDVVGTSKGSKIRLVKGSYFTKMDQQRKAIQRRQDIPEEYFWDKKITRQTVVVALSYPWLSKEHPDPERYHLALLGPMFEQFHKFQQNLVTIYENKKDYEGDVAVFMDYTSLFQHVRNELEENLFQEGLKTMALLYAHSRTTIWSLSDTPNDVRSYDNRGWCMFEFSIASTITTSNRLLKLGREARGKVRGIKDFEKEVIVPYRMARKPPMTAEEFENKMKERAENNELSVAFTKEKDRNFVIHKYKATLNDQFREVDRLEFDNLGWTDHELEKLIDFFPLCQNLSRLHMRNNKLTDKGATLMAQKLPSTVTMVDLTGNALLSLEFSEEKPGLNMYRNKYMSDDIKRQQEGWERRYFDAFMRYYKNGHGHLDVTVWSPVVESYHCDQGHDATGAAAKCYCYKIWLECEAVKDVEADLDIGIVGDASNKAIQVKSKLPKSLTEARLLYCNLEKELADKQIKALSDDNEEEYKRIMQQKERLDVQRRADEAAIQANGKDSPGNSCWRVWKSVIPCAPETMFDMGIVSRTGKFLLIKLRETTQKMMQ